LHIPFPWQVLLQAQPAIEMCSAITTNQWSHRKTLLLFNNKKNIGCLVLEKIAKSQKLYPPSRRNPLLKFCQSWSPPSCVIVEAWGSMFGRSPHPHPRGPPYWDSEEGWSWAESLPLMKKHRNATPR